ncbi:hypothetical protein [Microtetraspora sp. NBRC 16547]|uniref:hypothetical protein n=1 Tax=Microtetraspora sp. NBRC 16547 TaxID=3030993 RepID=UPI0024A42B96|nr:hypothetical protein [Microtetraspora sp. NBRC 16547]GLX00285.1 hypothetical protein Misp02_43710 [Microtetraspora sp. NBRC 16547]
MIADRVTQEREANLILFRVVHEVAVRHAGQPFHEVLSILRRALPSVPGLDEPEVRRIAEQISVGRDPSGL